MAIKKQFSSFEDLLKSSELPVLVDFYATWCGPCQMMAPILEQVGANLRDRLQIVKIDTDKSHQKKYYSHIQLDKCICQETQGSNQSEIQ